MQEIEKIQGLEKDVIHLKLSVDNQSKILIEVKDILHQQNSILQNFVSIKESVNNIREDLEDLEKTFNERREVTDTNNKNFSEFVAKFKGGLAVAIFFFGIVQGAVAFVLADNYDMHKNFQRELQEIRIEGAILKEKIKVQNLNKTVQSAVENAAHN